MSLYDYGSLSGADWWPVRTAMSGLARVRHNGGGGQSKGCGDGLSILNLLTSLAFECAGAGWAAGAALQGGPHPARQDPGRHGQDRPPGRGANSQHGFLPRRRKPLCLSAPVEVREPVLVVLGTARPAAAATISARLNWSLGQPCSLHVHGRLRWPRFVGQPVGSVKVYFG